ncbi:MAG TPA: polysaccharide biosynthesis protein [Nocardioidaceae bacterium]|nr:polysaccharide biosynthesis protein [Nocardioidaceae bacterium]
MSSTATRTRVRAIPAWLVGGGAIAVAMGVMNLTTYGFTMLAARLLGPAEYGALAAVMGLLLVVNVVSLGLQATGARRVAAAPHDRHRIESEVLATTYRAAAGLGVLCLVLVPLVSALLELDSWGTAALIAATAVPLTVMGGLAGILQGEQRWLSLGAIYLCVGLARIALGGVALLVAPTTFSAMVGVTLGAVVPAVVGWFALRRPGRQAEPQALAPPASPAPAPRGVLHETMHNSHALLAFFALSNVDVVIARTVLPEHQAGLYAAGLILAKAVLFLPQFVVVVAFPSMSRAPGARMHLRGVGLILVIGAVTTGLVAALSWLAVIFVGGTEYAAIQERLWAFAVLGTLLAAIQLLIYGVVARQHRRAVYVVWAALVLIAAASPWVASPTFLVTVVIGVDAALFVTLLLSSTRRTTSGSPHPV